MNIRFLGPIIHTFLLLLCDIPTSIQTYTMYLISRQLFIMTFSKIKIIPMPHVFPHHLPEDPGIIDISK